MSLPFNMADYFSSAKKEREDKQKNTRRLAVSMQSTAIDLVNRPLNGNVQPMDNGGKTNGKK